MTAQHRKPIPSQRVSTTTTTTTTTTTATAAGTPSTSPYTQPYLAILILSLLIATIYSIFTQSSHVQSFRSRLPASSISSASDTFLPPKALPYFADKRNFFNQYFVKLGWGWTTLAWSAAVSTSLLFPPKPKGSILLTSTSTPQLLLTHIRRYALSTLTWYYLTQKTWFLLYSGPSLSHHLLLLSGAQCVPAAIGSQTINTLEPASLIEPVCTGSGKGEYWKGGHDVSGHIFMMILASLLLLETIAPLLPYLFTFLSPPGTSSTSYNSSIALPLPTKIAIYATMALMAIWYWMMLMTATYFHTPAEKLTGALFGVAGWWLSSGMW